jgi:hypothetical protein
MAEFVSSLLCPLCAAFSVAPSQLVLPLIQVSILMAFGKTNWLMAFIAYA